MDTNNSLDKLAHIANISLELHGINVKDEKFSGPLEHISSNIDGRESSPPESVAKMRRLACTGCRQQKSRCDAREHYPDPCSRCQKKGIQCQLIPEFKRTQKRARIALIEKEFAKLKQSFMAPLAAADILKMAPILSDSVLSVSPPPGVTRSGSLYEHLETNSPGDLLVNYVEQPDSVRPSEQSNDIHINVNNISNSKGKVLQAEALVCEEKSLDSVILDPDTIRRLFTEFVEHYHPILPVVDVDRGPERIYRVCPALFWVIMFVALRRHSDPLLLLHLAPLIKNILAEITISPITRYNPTEEDEPIMNALSVFSVQAFILYTYWPLLTSSLSADSSWNTIGVALFQAIRIGLHSSGQLLEDKSQHAMAQENMRTWVVCNIVAQNIATAFGFPAFVQFDSIRANSADISLSTRYDLEIAHFEDQVAKTLTISTSDSDLHVSERIALIKVLVRQLDDLEVKLAYDTESDDGYRKFHALVARTHLLTHYFLDASHISPFDLSKGLVRLYNAAISLISHVHMCEAKNEGFVRYMPAVAMLSIWQASCIIVKLANSPLKKVIDVESGKQAYLVAISLVAHASVLKHDIAYRASGIMRNMWQLFKTLDDKGMTGFEIRIRSRMAASLFFDCLSLLRDQVGMKKFHIRTDVRENSAEDNVETNAVSSEDEPENPSPKSESAKSTPGNSNSSKVRKKRSLSGLQDAESKARRIIRTIPLDPPPISATKRSSIFKIVNTSTDTLPSVANEEESRLWLPQDILKRQDKEELVPTIAVGPADDLFAEIDSHDSIFDANSDSIWKDVDSLMNDFGFHNM